MEHPLIPWPRWAATGASATGRSHRRKALPNQDALAWWAPADASAAVLAVADGHGDARSPRSDAGAAFAAQAALDTLRSKLSTASTFILEEDAIPDLLDEIVERWRQSVLAHLREHPLPPQEEADDELAAWDPFLAYGTTLLAVVVVPGSILALQIGDGDILFVDDDGKVTRPLPADPRLLANTTTSVCAADATREFRTYFAATQKFPALILAATDGYANSYPDDKSFQQVGSDLLALIRSQGIEVVTVNLPHWLEETSNEGSGDDTTVGILWRIDPT